jgi:hypothetical protein
MLIFEKEEENVRFLKEKNNRNDIGHLPGEDFQVR